MRSLSRRIRLGAALLIFCSAFATYAGERSCPSSGVATQNRILPPIGAPSPAPQPTLSELLWMWLQAQAKIGPPAG